jgi:hypothetical protein
MNGFFCCKLGCKNVCFFSGKIFPRVEKAITHVISKVIKMCLEGGDNERVE